MHRVIVRAAQVQLHSAPRRRLMASAAATVERDRLHGTYDDLLPELGIAVEQTCAFCRRPSRSSRRRHSRLRAVGYTAREVGPLRGEGPSEPLLLRPAWLVRAPVCLFVRLSLGASRGASAALPAAACSSSTARRPRQAAPSTRPLPSSPSVLSHGRRTYQAKTSGQAEGTSKRKRRLPHADGRSMCVPGGPRTAPG